MGLYELFLYIVNSLYSSESQFPHLEKGLMRSPSGKAVNVPAGTEQTLITYLLTTAQDGPNTLYVKTNNELQILKEHKVQV